MNDVITFESADPTATTCPTPHLIETTPYESLARDYGYSKVRHLLDDIAPMVARGQVTTLVECHPSLHEQLTQLTEGWSFDELHSCVSHLTRQSPKTLKQLRFELGNPDYNAMRYELLRIALKRDSDVSRRVMQSFTKASTSVPFEPIWFMSGELRDLFGITHSGDLSRASRNHYKLNGHYFVRRQLTEADYESGISRVYTYVYRPVSLEEKIQDLADVYSEAYLDKNLGRSAVIEVLANDFELEESYIDEVLGKDVQPLNPFDATAHTGYINFENVPAFLEEKGLTHLLTDFTVAYDEDDDVDLEVVEDSESPVYHFFEDDLVSETPVVSVDVVALQVEAVLRFAQLSQDMVPLQVLAEITDSPVKDVVQALNEVDEALLIYLL